MKPTTHLHIERRLEMIGMIPLLTNVPSKNNFALLTNVGARVC